MLSTTALNYNYLGIHERICLAAKMKPPKKNEVSLAMLVNKQGNANFLVDDETPQENCVFPYV